MNRIENINKINNNLLQDHWLIKEIKLWLNEDLLNNQISFISLHSNDYFNSNKNIWESLVQSNIQDKSTQTISTKKLNLNKTNKLTKNKNKKNILCQSERSMNDSSFKLKNNLIIQNLKNENSNLWDVLKSKNNFMKNKKIKERKKKTKTVIDNKIGSIKELKEEIDALKYKWNIQKEKIKSIDFLKEENLKLNKQLDNNNNIINNLNRIIIENDKNHRKEIENLKKEKIENFKENSNIEFINKTKELEKEILALKNQKFNIKKQGFTSYRNSNKTSLLFKSTVNDPDLQNLIYTQSLVIENLLS